MKPLGEMIININLEIEGDNKRTKSTRVSDRDVVRVSAEKFVKETSNNSVTIEVTKDEDYAP
ncbi:hypothetical protein [Bacillus subtilis]|uniref:hypothetical protein n=1 Tax=Bacillus subtilis TaxID=1423 RepID=UPI0022B76740|nr:hypothetical protein [Bacillus subtilis]WBC26252.1 hypothetical protein O6U12_01810 [Bacillus subtilis]